jgi:hypothetical protein
MVATDDRQHQRQAVPRGKDDALRAAPDAHPCAQTVLGAGEHALLAQRGPGLPAPRHRLLLQQQREEVQLLLEQRLVVLQVESEQRERLGERPSPEDHLGASTRDRVERREALEDAHGLVGAEHRDR